jgi:hypothetical protein
LTLLIERKALARLPRGKNNRCIFLWLRYGAVKNLPYLFLVIVFDG